MDIKKTWVACTRLSHIQALETALHKDKQPVGPRREVYTPYARVWDINHPRGRFDCGIFLCSNFPGLDVEDNVRKRPFPFGCPYKRCPQPQDSIKILTRQPFEVAIGRCKFTNKIKTKQENSKKLTMFVSFYSEFIVSECN